MALHYKWPLGLSLLLLLICGPLWAGQKVDLNYHVRLLPQSDQAEVRLTLAEGSAVRSLDFDLGEQAATPTSRPTGSGNFLPGAGGCGGPHRAVPA